MARVDPELRVVVRAIEIGFGNCLIDVIGQKNTIWQLRERIIIG